MTAWKYFKFCACKIGCEVGIPSSVPGTKNEPEMLQPKNLLHKAKRCLSALLVAKFPWSLLRCSKNKPEVFQVRSLLRKISLRCFKCWACDAGTQNEARPIYITRRQTSADFYEGAQSAAPATQNCANGDVLRMLCWWCCVDGVVLMVMCWGYCVDGVVVMVLCWWCVVNGDVLMMLCWWWCCVNSDIVCLAAGGGIGRRDGTKKFKYSNNYIGNYFFI